MRKGEQKKSSEPRKRGKKNLKQMQLENKDHGRDQFIWGPFLFQRQETH